MLQQQGACSMAGTRFVWVPHRKDCGPILLCAFGIGVQSVGMAIHWA